MSTITGAIPALLVTLSERAASAKIKILAIDNDTNENDERLDSLLADVIPAINTYIDTINSTLTAFISQTNIDQAAQDDAAAAIDSTLTSLDTWARTGSVNTRNDSLATSYEDSSTTRAVASSITAGLYDLITALTTRTGTLEDTVLGVTDTTLDELAEIVEFIKQNREDLDALSVDNIAGLETALDGIDTSITALTARVASLETTLATESSNGLMSSTQVTKLNSIKEGAEVNPDIVTETTDGLMSAEDKAKLNTIEEGAEQNPENGVTVLYEVSDNVIISTDDFGVIGFGEDEFDVPTEHATCIGRGDDNELITMDWNTSSAIISVYTVDSATGEILTNSAHPVHGLDLSTTTLKTALDTEIDSWGGSTEALVRIIGVNQTLNELYFSIVFFNAPDGGNFSGIVKYNYSSDTVTLPGTNTFLITQWGFQNSLEGGLRSYYIGDGLIYGTIVGVDSNHYDFIYNTETMEVTSYRNLSASGGIHSYYRNSLLVVIDNDILIFLRGPTTELTNLYANMYTLNADWKENINNSASYQSLGVVYKAITSDNYAIYVYNGCVVVNGYLFVLSTTGNIIGNPTKMFAQKFKASNLISITGENIGILADVGDEIMHVGEGSHFIVNTILGNDSITAKALSASDATAVSGGTMMRVNNAGDVVTLVDVGTNTYALRSSTSGNSSSASTYATSNDYMSSSSSTVPTSYALDQAVQTISESTSNLGDSIDVLTQDISDMAEVVDGKAASNHPHAISDVADLQATLDGKAASSHPHAIADVSDLQSTLDGKAASNHPHAISDVADLQTALNGKSATGHGHAIEDVTGLQTALNGKAASSHPHAISDVADLQTALNGKSATGHPHAIADVSGLADALAAVSVDFTPVLLWSRDTGGSLSESFRNFSFVLIEFSVVASSVDYRDYIYVPESVIVTGSASTGTKIRRLLYNAISIYMRFSSTTTLTYTDYDSNSGGEYFESATFTRVFGVCPK